VLAFHRNSIRKPDATCAVNPPGTLGATKSGAAGVVTFAVALYDELPVA
jgi:hypothetical protein